MAETHRQPQAASVPRALLRSELEVLNRRYGVGLGAAEAQAVTDLALRRTENQAASVRVESALKEYLRMRDPERAAMLYNRMDGAQYYAGIRMGEAAIGIGGREFSVDAAIAECSRLPDPQRAERFQEIVAQAAELFRMRGEPPVNRFGLGYDIGASDPSEALSARAVNCFSGTIVLGQMILDMAHRAGVEGVQASLIPVPSYSIGGRLWDDSGHSILRVDISGRSFFFDSTNVGDRNQASSFSMADDGVTLRASGFSSTAYRLGRPLRIDRSLVETARLQDRLFDNPSPTARDVSSFPPLFLSYYVAHLAQDQQRALFSRFDPQSVRSPSLRYRLAATAATAFSSAGDEANASRFAAMALNAIGQAVRSGPSELGSLPMGSFLATTMDVIDIAGRMPRGAALIESSRAWAYLSYAMAHSSGEIPGPVAARARDFLSGFTLSHGPLIAGEVPAVALNLASGIMNSGLISGESAESAAALSAIYSRLGLDRNLLRERLAANARQTVVIGLRDEDIAAFLSEPRNVLNMERNFLLAADGILSESGRFSLESIRLNMARLTGGQAIMGQGIYRTLASRADLAAVLLAQGPMRDACRRRNLI
ncbi:MAG: hypothetical protein AB1324_08150 [Candidatus Micrarchaeota archaeon]